MFLQEPQSAMNANLVSLDYQIFGDSKHFESDMNLIEDMVIENRLLEGQLKLNRNIVYNGGDWDDDNDVLDDPELKEIEN